MHTAALVALALLLAQPALAEAPARVRFGISTPNQNVAWDDLLAAWKEADPGLPLLKDALILKKEMDSKP